MSPPGAWGGGGATYGYCDHCKIDHEVACGDNGCLCPCPIPPPEPPPENEETP